MRRLVICDDELIIQQQLCQFLERMQTECNEIFDILCFSSGEELLKKMPRDTQILLLDIKMGDLSGMDTARKLREKNKELCIIFITNMTQYALEGYDVHAFGFIKKPIQYEILCRKVQEALQAINSSFGMSLALKDMNQTDIYNTNDILYFEVYGRIVNVVTSIESKEYVVPLKKIENQLAGLGYYRCHKSFLVNCRHVKKISTSTLVMSDDREIALSKYRRNDFLKEFGRYVRGSI